MVSFVGIALPYALTVIAAQTLGYEASYPSGP